MIDRHNFAGRNELAAALAESVAADLVRGIAERGTGVIAVSGGTTPAKFFTVLGKRKEIDWEHVFVTLVDERWVPETSDRSNAVLVNEKMLQGPAATARFIPLYTEATTPDAAAIAQTIERVEALPTPFDAVVLGMGNDGHTASFFPGGDSLEGALTGTTPVLALSAPGAPEPRVTLGLLRLMKTRALYLHIEGEEKAQTLERALGPGPVEEMPIRAVLRQDTIPVSIYWSP